MSDEMPKIDFSKIPKIELEILARTFLKAIEEFYSDPANVERFNEWKESEEGKAYLDRIRGDEVD